MKRNILFLRLARLLWCLLAVWFISPALAADQSAGGRIPDHYKLVYEQSFDQSSSIRDFVMTDPKAWRWTDENDRTALELFQQSDYRAAVRSPYNIALIADKTFGDFILEVDMLQTGREYGHRDMCLFYNVQDPTHFYYTHIAASADPHAHNIFIVNDEPRTAIAKKTTDGIDWGENQWHKVRLERDTKKGTIKVYFDDLSEPLMIAEDNTFQNGYIGFGSFDDTGMVDNIKIWAPSVEEKPTGFYQKK
jgi:hypothetical protein